MKQVLSHIFTKAAKSLGLLPKDQPLPENRPRPPQSRHAERKQQKLRQQRAFTAMQKMEIQREFEIQNAINQSHPKTPVAEEPPSMETVREFKPVKTVRFKKPETNA